MSFQSRMRVYYLWYYVLLCIDSGVARPGSTRACALPSTFQALPSAAQQTHVIP